jgi:hypothetical protein
MASRISGDRRHGLSMLVGHISAGWCEIWHRAMHKRMQATTHFVYWWCRTCHRRWASKR